MAQSAVYGLDTPITKLPGCGPKRAEAFARLNIFTVGELLRHYPRGYQNRGDVRELKDAVNGETAAFVLTVATQPTTARLRGGRTMTKCRAVDDRDSCNLVFFNQPYIRDVLRVGGMFRFWGKLTRGKRGGLELYPSAVEQVTEHRRLREFFPLYPLSEGLTQKNISSLIEAAIAGIPEDAYPEILPLNVRDTFGVCGERVAFRCLHFPSTFADIDRGRTRFMAEELFLFACSVARNKESRRKGTAPEMVMERSRFDEFLPQLPFTLTRAQSRAISAIRKDMISPERTPMARLVSGDVGSGKTVCAAAAAYMTVRNGYQCALMAPTEILAAQHYRDLEPLFTRLGIRTELITGSTSAAEKRRIHALIASEEPCFIIGTHALISRGVEFGRLALVITDEQHRFGVMQRSGLASKGAREDGISPHVLVMSATPIPRTLALILCGDLDASVIDELPPGRQKVDTLVTGEENREKLNRFIEGQIEQGRQIYIVCPTVESKEEEEEDGASFLEFDYVKSALGEGNGTESGNAGVRKKELPWFVYDPEEEKTRDSVPPLKSAVDYAAQLREEIFPGRRVEFIHGRMSGAEKDKVMREFAAGNVDILVSTTVIEVGVNVPNASVMVVENAERFGLSQLHQLRGRVGRGQYKSYCVLVSSAKGENAVKRLDVMKRVSDGYEIAKYDLEMRGPGDFMPTPGNTRQHGEFRFKLAGLCSDTGMLQLAYAQAQELLEADPTLSAPENAGLRAELDRVFENGASALN